MKRFILITLFGLLTAGLASADLITKISLQGIGKSVEGGIAVNPVTHKAYVIAELATEGADDYKVVFVIDESILNGAVSAPKQLKIPVATTTATPNFIHIANENEYITIDSIRNLVYVATKYSIEEPESDSEGDTGVDGDPGTSDGEDLNGSAPPGSQHVIYGTLTVIDGNTDTIIATYPFTPGVEPEGVAVDMANSIVYVAAKAPEGESATDDSCSSGTPIYDVGEPGDVECWTAGRIYTFFVDRAGAPIIKYLKAIRAGDDPESIVFENGMVYAANEDDGTVTIASAVYPDGSGGELLTDWPTAPTQPYSLGIAPYSLGVFYNYGPNPLACVENKFEADKMSSGGGAVFVTDDRSRVAKITGTAVVGMIDIPGATICEAIPNTDGGGLNSANNTAFMARGKGLLYVVSEQNTVSVLDPADLHVKTTITVPWAVHLDGIAVDAAANRVWLTDEVLGAVFVLQGACAMGVGVCAE